MRQYTEADCMDFAGKPYTIHKRVIVLSGAGKAALIEKSGQLFYCLGGSGADLLHQSGAIVGISLLTGQKEIMDRKEVLGILQPGRLLWSERKVLAEISPGNHIREPFTRYLCYCLLGERLLAGGVWVHSWEDVVAYIELQREYQDCIVVCDQNERTIFEIHGQWMINVDAEREIINFCG